MTILGICILLSTMCVCAISMYQWKLHEKLERDLHIPYSEWVDEEEQDND